MLPLTIDRASGVPAYRQICDRPDRPTGPLNRVADASLAGQRLGWVPRVSLRDGLVRTIDWYRENRSVEGVRARLPELLLERGVVVA